MNIFTIKIYFFKFPIIACISIFSYDRDDAVLNAVNITIVNLSVCSNEFKSSNPDDRDKANLIGI